METVERLEDIYRLSEMLLRGGLVPKAIDTPEAVMSIILEGYELGISPMLALKQIVVIQGKAAASPQLMLSLIRRSGLAEQITIEDDGEACHVTMKRRGEAPHTERFGMDDADTFMTFEWVNRVRRDIPLSKKSNWLSQPKVMRKWRAVAACSRVVFPDVIGGMYTPDELGSSARVTDEGHVIDVETVESPAPPVPSEPGLFSKEHVNHTRVFTKWLSGQVDKINRQWQQGDGKGWAGWVATLEQLQEEGVGTPPAIPDLLNFYQVSHHLFRWAVQVGHLSFGPEIDVRAVQARQKDAYITRVDQEHGDAVRAELATYVKRLREDTTKAIWTKHPELAPEGWAEDQAEAARHAALDEGDVKPEPAGIDSAAHGDAYEGDLASPQKGQ